MGHGVKSMCFDEDGGDCSSRYFFDAHFFEEAFDEEEVIGIRGFWRHFEVVVREAHIHHFESLSDGFGVMEVTTGCEDDVGEKVGRGEDHFGPANILGATFDGIPGSLSFFSFCEEEVVGTLYFIFGDEEGDLFGGIFSIDGKEDTSIGFHKDFFVGGIGGRTSDGVKEGLTFEEGDLGEAEKVHRFFETCESFDGMRDDDFAEGTSEG